VRWPDDQPGGWHLHQEVGEDYCSQIVSEARMRKPSGGVGRVSRWRDNIISPPGLAALPPPPWWA
jgi:hypothetical protein